MNFESIADFIKYVEKVNANNSQNYKIEKLEEFFRVEKDNYSFKLVKLVYDNNINFFISEDFVNDLSSFRKNKNSIHDLKVQDLKEFYLFMKRMSNKEVSRIDIIDFYDSLNKDTKNLFIRCINKNLFDSVSNKILEKAYAKVNGYDSLYPKFPYMRCSLIDKIKHINYPAFSQIKMDGTYVNIIYRFEHTDYTEYEKIKKFIGKIYVEVYSRQGKKLEIGELLHNRLINYAYKKISDKLDFTNRTKIDVVFMGEALVKGTDGRPLDRKTGNGLITSIAKQNTTLHTLEEKYNKTKSVKLANQIYERTIEWNKIEQNIYFVLWDTMAYKYWQLEDDNVVPYSIRLETLKSIIIDKDTDDKIFEVVESKEVNSYEEALEHFKDSYSRGEEGTILKNMDLGWKDGTSNHQIKFKAVKECELKVTGYEMGSGKYSKGIGSLICESSDGLLKVSISGMTESERGLERVDVMDASKGLKAIDDFDFNKYTGKIITVEFNELIKAKDKEDYSLFLPRIKEFREDKTEADDLEYIKGL